MKKTILLQSGKIQKFSITCINCICVIILIISCSERERVNPLDPYNTNSLNTDYTDVIMPLKVGNSWKFSSGVELKVFSKTTVDEKEAFILKLYESDGGIDDLNAWANLSDGLYNDDNGILNLKYKYPGSVGEVYNVTDTGNYMEIVSISKTVSVQAGVFTDCYEYTYYDEGNLVESFIWKPKIGPLFLDDGSELVSYTLK